MCFYRHNLITINELLQSINKLQGVPDSSKFELIARVLDEDKDGVIDYNDAMKVCYNFEHLNQSSLFHLLFCHFTYSSSCWRSWDGWENNKMSSKSN